MGRRGRIGSIEKFSGGVDGDGVGVMKWRFISFEDREVRHNAKEWKGPLGEIYRLNIWGQCRIWRKMTEYESNIVQAFKDVCEANKGTESPGASPAEVTHLIADRGQISKLDTVIDIERIMRGLRNRGEL